MRTWTKPFVHNNRFYEATFSHQPLREKLECSVDVNGRMVRVANRGMGERDMIERVKLQIDKEIVKIPVTSN